MEGKGIIDHQSAMDLMTGAIGRLLPKLGEFLKQEHNLQTSMKEDIESLETQLRRMHDDTALFNMPRVQQDQLDSRDDKHCAYELRELSYDIEDIVDNLLLSIDDGCWEPLANQDTFRETLEDVMAQVKNLAAWHADFVAKPTISTVDPSLEYGFVQMRQFVGIQKLRAEFISKMSSSPQRLKIVSIWAPGGMGKTTLAKTVYENIRGDFHCSAFVSVGQQHMNKVLRDIIMDLYKERYNDLYETILNEWQLIDELQYFLKNKRFLIALDDIPDIVSWKKIEHALIDSGCGSRIITTSRVFDVAESSGEVFKLMPLTIDRSKELFYAMLSCGRKGTITFDQLIEQSTEYILQKCGGVPLAIIMIASLLAGKQQEEWTEVYKSIGFGQEDNIDAENNTRKIIQFSYYDLPSHLKTCLLYLSIFPEDHVIKKDTLVWRWVAEGFVHDEQQQGQSLFKVGERYLYELIRRGMVQAVENEDTNMRGCRVEGMVLEWICTVAKEENFVTVSGDWWYDDDDQHVFCHQSNDARIVAVRNSRIQGKPHDDQLAKPKVRSFNGTGCSIISSRSSLQPAFQVLRVLSLEYCKLPTADCLTNTIAGLLHLRYLGLGGTAIRDLPFDIGGLRYLQTLDLTDTNIERLPHSVTELRQLKCLRCFGSARLELPQRMGNLTLLEELWLGTVGRVDELQSFAKELSKLTELRVLRVHTGYSFGGKQSEALVESISRLQKIEVMELLRMGGGYIADVYNYFGRQLGSQEPCHHVIVPCALPNLRYLKMNTWLRYQPGAMPQLKSVELDIHVWAFKDANFDFDDFFKLNYLSLLETAHFGINCQDVKMEEAEEVEAVLRCALQSHPNRPKLIVTRFGRCLDEISAGSAVFFSHSKSAETNTNQHQHLFTAETIIRQNQPNGVNEQIHSLSGSYTSQVGPQPMPLEEPRKITNDFSNKHKLGSGKFGTVNKIHSLSGLHTSQVGPQPMPLEQPRKITNDFSGKHKLGSGTFETVYKIHSLGGLHTYQVGPQPMPLEELRKITNGFSDKHKLGSGTFGTVYKGVQNGKEVAVKLLHSTQRLLNYKEEFKRELENLTRLNHPNIVQLLGYCYETKSFAIEHEGMFVLAKEIYRALCFEYMHNGSLQEHLDDKFNTLDWQTCYKIIKGTCEGLKYLHEGSEHPMYHLDLKPGNILLDKNMVPKIADFGLSKFVRDNETRTTSSLLGTIRYCPPEYIEHRFVSNKFDIFSLGVVMIEIIAGSEGYNKAYELTSQEFIDHVQENWRKGLQATAGYTSLIYDECHQVKRCTEIALHCVSADRKQRPNIGDVTNWLNEIENNAEKMATTFITSQKET